MLNQIFQFKPFPVVLALSALFTGFQEVSADYFSPPLTETLCESYTFCQDTRPTLEAKAGYFFFLDSKLQDIYTKGGIDVQIAGTYPLWKSFQLYGSVEYLERCGRSLGDNQWTSIYQIPVNVGLRSVHPLHERVQYYATLGPRYFYIHQQNDSSYVPRNTGRSGVGFFVNSGFNFIPTQRFIIDIFGEYSWGRINFHHADPNVYSRNLQVGGLTFGGGIGYLF